MSLYSSNTEGTKGPWINSGIKIGDMLIIEADGESLILNFHESFIDYLLNPASNTVVIFDLSIIHNNNIIEYSSTESNFFAKITNGQIVNVKFKDKEGNTSKGINIPIQSY